MKSLDTVLADVDASDQEIGNEAASPVEQASQETDQQQEADAEPGRDEHGALHAERQRVKRKYTETVADFEKKLAETNEGFEKKLAETLAQNDQRWEQRFSQFAQAIQPRQEPKADERPDLYENPDGFVQHGVKSAIDPVNQRISQITEAFSRRLAISEHGAEKVQAAFAALDQAARSGNREAQETCATVRQSVDPFGEIVAWHQRTSVLSEFGTDPEAAIQKRLAAALEDPAFLAKAAEKLGVKPRLVSQGQGNSQTLPSLNRATAAAGNDDEEEDAREVFNTALRSGVRR